jgi:energy-converting hydrogenase A subunit R
MLVEITPIGGEEKAKAVMTIASNLESNLEEVVYVGDSITDVQALQLVKEQGGLAISFNGNRYAVANADIAVLSDTALVTAILVEVFSQRGKKDALNLVGRWSPRAVNLVGRWSPRAVEEEPIHSSLVTALLEKHPSRLPHVQVVDDQNVEALIEESSRFRMSVRGESIGRLG